ncbi:MAG: hypothetical protein JXR12_06540 [Neptunomonas phycophila]|uniref:hypothetical protein n=1 Tax=Neptunomonas phycophila TaxID=1572645 RepID=UPI003B8BDAEE
MRLEEFYMGNGNVGPTTIDGGLPIPVTPAYGEDRYTKTDKGQTAVYNDEEEDKEGGDTEEEFAVVKPRLRAILKLVQQDDEESDGSDLPNASDYALGLDDEALKAQL